jgi:hypothetical protein
MAELSLVYCPKGQLTLLPEASHWLQHEEPAAFSQALKEFFAIGGPANATILCIGSVTRAETERAKNDGLEIDGTGYYLFLANATAPREPFSCLQGFFRT